MPPNDPGAAGALARWLLWPEREMAPATGGAELVQMARAEGLAPLLYFRARKTGIGFAPEAAGLAADYHASLASNTYMLQELAGVLAAAAEQGLDLIVLKGAHLATWLYPSPATRPMADVDLLVRREQVQSLISQLCARGFQVVSREPRHGAGMEFENQVLLAHTGQAAHGCIALHWSLLDFPSYQRQLRMEPFWQRAVPYTLQGACTRVLCAEDLLVYLCAHLALHHQWSRLIWLCDIALLVERLAATLDWERACTLAASAHLSLALRETLRRAVDTLGAQVPPSAWSLLDAAPVSAAEQFAWQELAHGRRSSGRSFWANLRAMQGMRARLDFALAHLLPSPEYMRQRYQLRNDWHLPAAYAGRWLLGIRSLRRPTRERNPALPGKP